MLPGHIPFDTHKMVGFMYTHNDCRLTPPDPPSRRIQVANLLERFLRQLRGLRIRVAVEAAAHALQHLLHRDSGTVGPLGTLGGEESQHVTTLPRHLPASIQAQVAVTSRQNGHLKDRSRISKASRGLACVFDVIPSRPATTLGLMSNVWIIDLTEPAPSCSPGTLLKPEWSPGAHSASSLHPGPSGSPVPGAPKTQHPDHPDLEQTAAEALWDLAFVIVQSLRHLEVV